MFAPRRFPSLQGVRALAVLAVMAVHTGIPGTPGGFVGVDVFFVLSGFLITSLLLDEHVQTGRAHLPSFWGRRARRLLPAALVMIATVIAARPLFPPQTTEALRGDALSAALWSANWRWATQGTDYFAQGGNGSPLQHTWSLAVEEQFYVAWPVLLAVVLIGAHGARQRGSRVFSVAAVGVAASVIVTYQLCQSATPGRVYFGTDTRAQQLLVGAVLAAILAPTWRWRNSARRARRSPQVGGGRALPALLTVGGLAGLAAATHWVHGTPSDFRHGLMIGVSISAAAFIAGLVLDGGTLVARLLASPPLVWLGGISYGVYLWHWPTFEVLTGERTGLHGYPLAGARVATTIALATISAYAIERPAYRIHIRPRRLLSVAVAGVVGVLMFTAYAAPAGQNTTANSGSGLPPGALSAAAKTAEPATANTVKGSTGRHDGPLVVDVFGDSIAWTLVRYSPALDGVQLVDRTALGCGIVQGAYEYFGEQYDPNPSCATWPDTWRGAIQQDRPDAVVLLVGRWETMDRVVDGVWSHLGDPSYDAMAAGLLHQAVTVLGSTGAQVIVSTEPFNRRGEQPDGTLYPEDDPARVTRWNELIAAEAARTKSIGILDLNSKLCPDGSYTWDVDGVRVRDDGVHVSVDGAAWLAPWLTSELVRLTGGDQPAK